MIMVEHLLLYCLLYSRLYNTYSAHDSNTSVLLSLIRGVLFNSDIRDTIRALSSVQFEKHHIGVAAVYYTNEFCAAGNS